VLLVTLFKKADQDNINAGEKAEMRKLIDEILIPKKLRTA
jgi:hypothetical protein